MGFSRHEEIHHRLRDRHRDPHLSTDGKAHGAPRQVLRQGNAQFMLEYFAPNPLRIRFSGNYLNVTSGGNTEVLEVGSNVRHAQSFFSRENSIENLKKDFIITVRDESRDYEMRLVPRTDAFRRRLNYMVVKLSKKEFLPQSLEVDGKSGVNSVFAIDVTSVNVKIPAETFEVIKPR